MTRFLAVVVFAVSALALAAPSAAHASGGSCSVSPDPVPAGTSYVLTVTGLPPDTAYVSVELVWQQTGNVRAAILLGDSGTLTTDSSGSYSQSLDANLQPGKVWVTISNYHTAVPNIDVRCAFTVTG